MRGRRLPALVALAMGALAVVWSAGCAPVGAASAGQPAPGLRITSPVDQSGVTQGETVAVVGDGCAPDAAVDLEFNGRPIASTQADAQGAFRGSITVPTYVIDDTVEEASEASIAAGCGDQRVAVLVAVSEAEDGVGDLDALPETGAGTTVALSMLAAGLIAAGAALVRCFGVRPARGAR